MFLFNCSFIWFIFNISIKVEKLKQKLVAELPEEAKHYIENAEEGFLQGATRLFSLEADVNTPVQPTTTPLLARTTTVITTTTHAPPVETKSDVIVEDNKTDLNDESIDKNLDNDREATKRRIVSLFSDRARDSAILSTTTIPPSLRITTVSTTTTTYSSTTHTSESSTEAESDALLDDESVNVRSDGVDDREATKRRIVSLFSDRTRGEATASLFGPRDIENTQEESLNLAEELKLMLDEMNEMKVHMLQEAEASKVKIEESRETEQEINEIKIGEGRRIKKLQTKKEKEPG